MCDSSLNMHSNNMEVGFNKTRTSNSWIIYTHMPARISFKLQTDYWLKKENCGIKSNYFDHNNYTTTPLAYGNKTDTMPMFALNCELIQLCLSAKNYWMHYISVIQWSDWKYTIT